jgi:hypothetical protein
MVNKYRSVKSIFPPQTDLVIEQNHLLRLYIQDLAEVLIDIRFEMKYKS